MFTQFVPNFVGGTRCMLRENKRTLNSSRRPCLVESSYPGPVSPGPRLLAPLAVRLRRVDTVVLGSPEAQQHAELLPRPPHLLAGQDGLHDGECSLPQPPTPLPSLSLLTDLYLDKILSSSPTSGCRSALALSCSAWSQEMMSSWELLTWSQGYIKLMSLPPVICQSVTVRKE